MEQIGSVYETVMGFTIETRTGPALAIRAGKNDRTPVFVDIAALAAKKGPDRAKFLKEEAGRNALSDKVSKALSAAADAPAVVEALMPIVDERGSPGGALSPPGSPLLQPTDERRRTGSHYTPRSLTAPIVQYALEPAFDRLGPDARPEDVLELKVCDPAMGSGAFLVEACRALGERLVKAWTRWPETRPKIPEDEDDQLHARRLVAQRCLYGVDKNPRAVDLAKLSLWLATLARDHEFTFLDHALKCGDSLVGSDNVSDCSDALGRGKASRLSSEAGQRSCAGGDRRRASRNPEQRRTMGNAQIQEAAAPRFKAAEVRLDVARHHGRRMVAAFFAADKAKAAGEKAHCQKSVDKAIFGRRNALEAAGSRCARACAAGEHPIPPFHWQVEFPEVFARDNGGFDAIVGNPPFAGKEYDHSRATRRTYLPWLQTLHEGAHGNADLVAHFFRRAFGLLRTGGVFGLIATNTIGQGDTRASGLTNIIADGGAIFARDATIEMARRGCGGGIGRAHRERHGTSPVLDRRQVRRISAYLVEGDLDTSPVCAGGQFRQGVCGLISYSAWVSPLMTRPRRRR